MAASTSSTSNQPNDHVTIYKIISNQQNEGLRDDDYEQIERILNNCDVNARLNDCSNETLMHVAIREQNEKLIKLIYNYGGDFFVINELNQTPRDLAVEINYINIIEFIDENEIIRFEDEEFFEENMNITNENKRNIKAIKLSDESKLDELFLNEEICETFPNLFAFKILNKSENERIVIDKISAHFNDGRPLLVYFQCKPSFFYYKRENSEEFEVANAEISEEIQVIFNQRQIPISLIEKYCKSNDSLMIRILKLRKSLDDLKMIESVLKLSDDFEMFQAVIYEPFSHYTNDFIGIEEMTFCDYYKSLLELAIQHDVNYAVEYLTKNFEFFLHYLPLIVKKKLVDYVAHKKMTNYQDTLYKLIELEFPFPENVDEINDEKFQKIKQDREIFKSNNLEGIKKYVNENNSMRIGYDSKNKSALLCAIENKNFNVYSFLLSVGFCTDNAHELKEKIDKLSDEEKDSVAIKNALRAHSDDKNHLRLLTNRFGIFDFSENKEQHKAHFDKIFKFLEELDSIERCKPLLRFCSNIEILKVTLDFENTNVSGMVLDSNGLGETWPTGLIFVGAKHDNSDEIKKTIIHELCHFAMLQFYENNFRPYYCNDQVHSEKFKEITEKILRIVKFKKEDCCNGILTAIEKDYKPEQYQNEMIVRAFEIFVEFNGRENEMNKLPKCYAQLIDYVDEHVVKALSGNDFKNRAKVRSLNSYIGLLQNIREANERFQLCENTENDEKLLKIFESSKKEHFIVSNVPILALINIENHLSSTQKSLYDAKNIFLDPKQLEIQKKLEEFKNLQENVSSLIIEISNGCKYKEFSNKTKLIFVTSKDKFYESQSYLDHYDFEYNDIEINYKWTYLSKESQNKLVEKVNFQGKEFKLSELINESLINDSIIDDEIFFDFCDDGKIVNINVEVNQFEAFVERQFNKIVEKKEQEVEIEESKNINESDDKKEIELSSTENVHPFQMVLARYKEKLNEKERVEEAFADSHMDFVTKVENNSKILISDIAGSGKSYILKKISHLLMRKCDNSNNYWVLFIDLRKYLNEFYKWKDQKCFLTFFKTHFGQILKFFEKKIFEIFYNSGKVKILLDGFDEISPKCKDIVIEFIKSIDLNAKNSNIPSSSTSAIVTFHNQLWITTRKHLEFELQDRLEISEIFSLKSLETDLEMAKFLIAYWSSKDIQPVSFNNLKNLAQQVILKFRQIKLDDRNLIGKIQQLKILAEICIQNDEIKVESLSNFTMYDIYEKSTEQFIENWKKRPDCKELARKVDMGSSPNFIVNHQHRALLESIDKEMVANLFSHFGRMWDLEQLEKGGLVTFENEKAYFIHTTYLEFFIANFIVLSLENSLLSYNLIELFCQIMFVPYLTTTQMFINDKIQSLDLNEEMIEIFAEHFNTKLFDFNIFELSIKQNHENVFEFLMKILKNVDKDKKKLILVSEPEYPLFLSLLHSKNYVINELLKITSEYLIDDEFYELMRKKVKGFTIFHLFYSDNVTSKMLNSLIFTMEHKIEDKIKELLLCKGGNYNGLSIQIIISNTNSDNFDKLEYYFNYHLKYMSLEELIESSVIDSGHNILHFIAWNINLCVHETFWEKCKIEFKSNKSKLNQLLDKRDKDNMNFLHALVCTEKSSVEILKFNLNKIEEICDVKSLLLSKGQLWNGLSIQMLVSNTTPKNLDNFEYFFDYHFKYMSLEELIEYSANSDKENNILHYIASNLNLFVHKKFWEQCKIEFQTNKSKLIQLLDKRNKINDNFLQTLVCVEKSSVEILKYNLVQIEKICNIKTFLLSKGQLWNGLSIQMLLVQQNPDNLDKFEYYFNYHLEYMSLEELIENSVEAYGNNFLHYIASNLNIFVHEKLWERLKIDFKSNESKLIQLLDKRNKNNNNFFHRLVWTEKSSVEILKYNLFEIEKICDMKIFLLCRGGNSNHLSIQMLINATNSDNLEKFEYFFNYHFHYMSLEELIENGDDDGSSILNDIAYNLNMFVHEKLWERCKIEFQSNKSKLSQLLHKTNKYNNNAFQELVGTKKSSIEILKLYLTEIENICDMKKFLVCRCQPWNGLSIQILLKQTNSENLDKFGYFFNYHFQYMSLEELIENSVNDYGHNILHYIAWNLYIFVHEKFWERCKDEFQMNQSKLKQLLDKRNKNNRNFLHELVCIEKSSVEILIYNLSKIEEICDIKDFLLSKGESWNGLPIQMLIIATNSENIDKFEYFYNYHFKYMSLEELIENGDDDNGQNILHCIASNINKFVHEKLWERCKIEFQTNKSKLYQLLDKRNNDSNNFLHAIVWTKESSLEILNFNLIEISNFFNNSFEIFSSKGHNDNILLQIALVKEQSFEFLKTLWNFIKDSCSRDNFVKHINELNSDEMNFFYITLKMTEKENNTKAQFIEFIIDSLENDLKLSQIEMKSFLRPQIDFQEKENILTFMAKNVASIEIHEYLWRLLENVFDANEILGLINEVDLNGLNLLSIVVASNIQEHLNVVEFTWNKIKNYLKTTDEQRIQVEKCVMLHDQFPNERWLIELFNSYEIDLTTHKYAKRKKN